MQRSSFEKRLLTGLSLTFAALLLAAAALTNSGNSWPMWGGTPDRNMSNVVEKNMPSDWDVRTKKNIKWVAAVGSRCYGNPVVADGKVFVGTNNEFPRPDGELGRNPKITGDKGIVMCFRQSDGEFLWQAVFDKLPAGRVNDWPQEGICSTVAVEGKRVYFVSNRCTLVCADTEGFLDGKNDGMQDEKYQDKSDADIIWELDMMSDMGVFPHNLATSSPLIVDDIVYILTSNGVDEGHLVVPSPKAPSFIAVNKNTGKVVWTDDSPGDRIFHGQWSSPTYGVVNGKGQIYMPGGDGWLYAFDPLPDPANPGKGKLLWKFDCNPPESKYVLGGRGTANEIISTAVFKENIVYVAVGQDPEHGQAEGHLWAIDATKTGDVSEFVGDWDPVERMKINPKKNPNSAMIWHYGGEDFGRTMSTVAIEDGLLFAVDLGGFLHCLNLKTGERHWQHDTLAEVWSSPYIVDKKVYLGDTDGDVCIFELSKTKKLIKEINMHNPVPTTAVAVDGVLFLATKAHVYAIEQK